MMGDKRPRDEDVRAFVESLFVSSERVLTIRAEISTMSSEPDVDQMMKGSAMIVRHKKHTC
jgi:hypothetical protein